MTKSQPYYYEDVVFQLELNLQTIRRELIKLIEEYKSSDCYSCNRIKCRCSTVSSFRSTTVSIVSSDSACAIERYDSEHPQYTTAPPPETLPAPKWPENKTRNRYRTLNTTKPPISLKAINAWIKASIPNINLPKLNVHFPVPRKVLDSVNYSWPPFAKSIWSDEMLLDTIEREARLFNEVEQHSYNSVEAFFMCFSDRSFHETAFRYYNWWSV